MPIVNLTTFLRDDDGHGWSETHQVDGGVSITSLVPILDAFDNFNKTFRVPLLASDGFYIGCRASYPTPDGQRAGSNRLAQIAISGTDKVGSTKIYMNAASDAVKVAMQNAGNTARSDIYLRGVWDDVMSAGQLDFSGAVGGAFERALKNYTDALRGGGYGWLGVNPATTPRGNVTSAIQNVDGTVTFTVAVTNGKAMPIALTRASVKFSHINSGKSILNRTYVCVVNSATSLTTVKQVAFGTFASAGTFILANKGFIPYDHFDYVRLSSRKTGKPFGVGRGRSPALTPN